MIKEQRLILGDMSDSNGLGKNELPWIKVQAGCFGSRNESRSELETSLQAWPDA